MAKICVWCGQEYQAKYKGNRSLYCSDQCQNKAQYLRKKDYMKEKYQKKIQNRIKICVQCGKEFTPKQGLIKTCSDECKANHSKTWQSKLDAKKHYEQTICLYCGIEFTPKQPNQKCCCERHGYLFWDKNRKKKYIYVCKGCGRQYKTHRKECDQYCTRECADDHKHRISEQKKLEQEKDKQSICLYCNDAFIKGHSKQKYCSRECARQGILIDLLEERKRKHIEKQYTCKECGDRFTVSFGNKHRSFCSDRCRRKHNQRIGKATRRARIRGNEYERFDPIDIFERDKWHCQLCGVKTPKKLRGSIDDRAPELDHIVPLALGGAHTLINVQCLCRLCNQSKGASIAGQLRLL